MTESSEIVVKLMELANLFVKHGGDLYQDEIMQAVELFEKQHNIHLLFGSLSHHRQPGYNYGGDGAHFYNLTSEQAEKIKAELVVQGIAESDIEIR